MGLAEISIEAARAFYALLECYATEIVALRKHEDVNKVFQKRTLTLFVANPESLSFQKKNTTREVGTYTSNYFITKLDRNGRIFI